MCVFIFDPRAAKPTCIFFPPLNSTENGRQTVSTAKSTVLFGKETHWQNGWRTTGCATAPFLCSCVVVFLATVVVKYAAILHSCYGLSVASITPFDCHYVFVIECPYKMFYIKMFCCDQACGRFLGHGVNILSSNASSRCWDKLWPAGGTTGTESWASSEQISATCTTHLINGQGLWNTDCH